MLLKCHPNTRKILIKEFSFRTVYSTLLNMNFHKNFSSWIFVQAISRTQNYMKVKFFLRQSQWLTNSKVKIIPENWNSSYENDDKQISIFWSFYNFEHYEHHPINTLNVTGLSLTQKTSENRGFSVFRVYRKRLVARERLTLPSLIWAPCLKQYFLKSHTNRL